MYLKKIVLGLCAVIFSCQGAEYSPPKSPRTPAHRAATSRSTPPRHGSAFWRGASSTESSPATSPVKPEVLSPFQSPLGKRKAGEPSGLDYLPAAARRLNFESVPDASIEGALDATSVREALSILGHLPPTYITLEVRELMRHLPQEPDLFNEAAYNDVWLAVVKSLNTKLKTVTGQPLSFLPLLPIGHIREGDSKGGYHLESPDKPVIRLIENPLTGVYGGTFGRTRFGSKFSSFFAETKSFNDVIRDIQHAFRKPLVSSTEGLIGLATDGSYIQILIAPWAIVARTAFPLIEYIPANLPENETIVLNHVDPRHSTPVAHSYTVGQLRALAARGRPAELDLENRSIMDVGEILTGRPEVRGVYVQMPAN